MSATSQLIRLLEQWRELTEREAHSILLGDWAALARYQTQKQRLTRDISLAQTALAGSSANGTDEPVRGLVAELKTMELRNRELLSARRQNLQAELDRVSETTRALRGVRRAYGGASTNCWHSYS